MLYICTKFCEIISNSIKVINGTWFLYWKLQRGIILQKIVGGAVVNLCMWSGHAFISTKFCKIIWNCIHVIELTRFLYCKLQRGIILQKIVGGAVVNLCMWSGHAFISTKFCEIIWTSIQVIELTRFLYWKLQRGIIPQKKCKWSDRWTSLHVIWSCFIFVPSSVKLSRTVSKL